MENIFTNTCSNYTTGSSSEKKTSEEKKKKQCGNRTQTVKLSTDPQSVAARNRRHRISDRFKILQSMVPGGTKMDTASMLEEAINYVKFLKAVIWFHENTINSVEYPHEVPVVTTLPESISYFPESFYSSIDNLSVPAEQYPVQASQPSLAFQDFDDFIQGEDSDPSKYLDSFMKD